MPLFCPGTTNFTWWESGESGGRVAGATTDEATRGLARQKVPRKITRASSSAGTDSSHFYVCPPPFSLRRCRRSDSRISRRGRWNSGRKHSSPRDLRSDSVPGSSSAKSGTISDFQNGARARRDTVAQFAVVHCCCQNLSRPSSDIRLLRVIAFTRACRCK